MGTRALLGPERGLPAAFFNTLVAHLRVMRCNGAPCAAVGYARCIDAIAYRSRTGVHVRVVLTVLEPHFFRRHSYGIDDCIGATVRQDKNRVDVVYLWVDGADPEWRRKRVHRWSEWSREHVGALEMYGNVEGRYRDNDELRFSLRALERFFPGHGKVWIVTDNQRPAWLCHADDMEIVDHRDLIPEELRPVFNSGNIESWIHRIPGLSERFFYMNDDVFFGAPVIPEQWFGERLALFVEPQAGSVHDELRPQETSMVNAATLSRRWMASRYADYQHDPSLFAHAPRPLLKSVLYEFEEAAPEMFARVRTSPFRDWRNPPIICDLLLRWMVHVGYATREVAADALYIESGDDDAALQFARLRARFEAIPYFCINDTCDDASSHDIRLQHIARVLPALMPEPSRFERPVTGYIAIA